MLALIEYDYNYAVFTHNWAVLLIFKPTKEENVVSWFEPVDTIGSYVIH